jgi:hypothetical protein
MKDKANQSKRIRSKIIARIVTAEKRGPLARSQALDVGKKRMATVAHYGLKKRMGL